jgi:monoterpene epsilon-lactone hydrolase
MKRPSPVLRAPAPVVRGGMRLFARVAFNPSLPIERQRRNVEATISRSLRPPRGTISTPTVLGGVSCERVVPPGDVSLGTVLYLHGGGFVLGSPRTHRSLSARVGRAARSVAVVPEYRLAPEHPYPAALDDVMAVYRALLDEGTDPGRLAVAGESAGGGLALSLGVAARDAGLPLPAVIGMISPVTDLSADGGVRRVYGPREPVLTRPLVDEWLAAYCADSDRSCAGLSPALGDLAGLPPLVLHSAADDPLLADSELLEKRARAAGASLLHERHPDLWHGFHILAGVLREADDAVAAFGAELRRFIDD